MRSIAALCLLAFALASCGKSDGTAKKSAAVYCQCFESPRFKVIRPEKGLP